MNQLRSGRLLIVDDDVRIRRAVQRAIAARGYDVMLAASGEEALALASESPPDMVILDMSLPGISGLDVCRELRTWTQIPILVLSVNDRSHDKVAALDEGADDYLTKPFDTAELLARIRSHLRRAASAAPPTPIVHAGDVTIDVAGRTVTRDGEEIRLTPIEFALLHYLAQNAGRVVTHGLLLSRVWGTAYESDVQTLRVHVANLRRKIERDPDRPSLITTEPGVGYRFRM